MGKTITPSTQPAISTRVGPVGGLRADEAGTVEDSTREGGHGGGRIYRESARELHVTRGVGCLFLSPFQNLNFGGGCDDS